MIELLTAASGLPTVRLDGRYLHSPRDPVREAHRAVRDLARRDLACVVMLGLGLGYHAEALLELSESTTVIVHEPDRDLQAQLESVHDFTALRTSSRVVWTFTADELQSALLRYAPGGFDVFTVKSRRDCAPSLFEPADDVLAAFRSRVDINTNTLKRFGRLWVRNLCRNTAAIARGRPVTLLRDAFREVPGLLLAAGPGLDQVLPRLPHLAERAVVVAVDTAVAAAHSAGVSPDIAVVVDPQYWNTRHLDPVRPGSTILVSESSAHPAVFRHFGDPPLFSSSLFPLGRAIESVVGHMSPLGTGGSVSTTAWDLLRFMGCRPILTAGLDLGFPSGRTHYRGSFFESLAVASGRRLLPAEHTVFRYVTSGGPFSVPAAPEGTVVSDQRMEIYRRWFAEQVAAPGAPPTVTLTTGGARITGVPIADGSELRRRPNVRGNVREWLARVTPLDRSERLRRESKLSHSLSLLAGELATLERLGEQALHTLDELEKVHRRGKPVDFGRLETVDREIARHAAREVASFLMQDAIARIREGFGAGDVEEQFRASRTLYRELRDSAHYHAQCMTTPSGQPLANESS